MEKSRLMMIVIIVLLVALLATVVGVGFYMLSTLGNIGNEDPTVIVIEGPKTLSEDQITKVPMGGNLQTNLFADGGPPRVAVVQFSVGYDNTSDNATEVAALLDGQTTVIRSIVLHALRESTYAQLSERDGSQKFEETVLERIRDAFPQQKNQIMNVYFEGFVLQ